MKTSLYYAIGFSKKPVHSPALIKYVNESPRNSMPRSPQMCFVWKLRYMMEEMEGEKNL